MVVISVTRVTIASIIITRGCFGISSRESEIDDVLLCDTETVPNLWSFSHPLLLIALAAALD